MLYTGEHLFPGRLGQSLVWISLISAFVSFVLYLLSHYRCGKHPLLISRSARYAFLVHFISLAGVGAVLYYILFIHYFEYSYVWQYSSRDLDMKYIISCFWAGQEGSFLVWALFQAMVGAALIFLSRTWESPVMAVVSASQVFVASMLLGTTILGHKIGQSPFALLRESVDSVQGTIFQDKNYMSFITDGNGLNPLLENVWMTIHPPVLFLGYAMALVPFAYAIASLLKKDYASWVNLTIPWTIASLAILGSGILLGGAWAYVSLTFGGFWSWDPVENSSLVPWMTLVAGLHFLLISRRQNKRVFMSYLLITLSYIMVLYASFLTRSGILADTSAHSFGNNGMTLHLMIFLLTFLAGTTVLAVIRYRDFPERTTGQYRSREFWMFIGALAIVMAAFQISFTTSIPVVNALFGTNFAPPSDPVSFYNNWQMPFLLMVVVLIAATQLLKYHLNTGKEFAKKLVLPVSAAILASLPLILNGVVRDVLLILLLFCIFLALFSVIANFLFPTSKPVNRGAVVTHLGFLLFMLGVLLTFSNARIISANTSQYYLGDARTNKENLMLMKHDTLYMGGYHVVYTDLNVRGNSTEYQVDFLKYKEGRFHYSFSLYPSVNIHPRMGEVHNPSTRHFALYDFYIYIVHASRDPDYIVIKAIMNPYINLLWIGALIMVSGFGYSWLRRIHR